MATALFPTVSALHRQAWVLEGILQAKKNSFWSQYTGSSSKSIIYQKNMMQAGEGHKITFDYDGNLSGAPVKGKETAFGKGEDKRKFSDNLTLSRYRYVVNNGDRFDIRSIGKNTTTMAEHADSRGKLADLFMRSKDQAIFDCAQGNLQDTFGKAQEPSHIIDLGSSFTYDDLIKIETILTASTGYSTGSIRRPIDAYVYADSMPKWYLFADNILLNKLRQDSAFQNIFKTADVRGDGNTTISGLVADVGKIRIVAAPLFFGSTTSTGSSWDIKHTEVEICGMRQYHAGTTTGSKVWTGQEGYSYTSTTKHSRAFIIGAMAMKLANGMPPEYMLQPSIDYGITSESCLEAWWGVEKVRFKQENTEYSMAKVANIDYGVIAVDVEI